jgi:hypothetical protein
MVFIELILILFTIFVGIIKPSFGIKLNDFFCGHLPSRDWYWGIKVDIRSSELESKSNALADRAAKPLRSGDLLGE